MGVILQFLPALWDGFVIIENKLFTSLTLYVQCFCSSECRNELHCEFLSLESIYNFFFSGRHF
jgi:hypothetical protein